MFSLDAVGHRRQQIAAIGDPFDTRTMHTTCFVLPPPTTVAVRIRGIACSERSADAGIAAAFTTRRIAGRASK